MRLWLWRTAAAIAALTLLTGASPIAVAPTPANTSDTLNNAERSVVRVVAVALDDYGQVGEISLGSGFVVAPGKVVTNNHVIAVGGDGGAVQIFVIPEADSHDVRQQATVVKTWPQGDLALLSAPRLTAPPLTISPALPSKESTVRALGYPGYTDEMRNIPLREMLSPAEPYVTPGAVALLSHTAPGGGHFETIFHTAPVNKGNSGGPLIDSCGRVIGVNTWAGALRVRDNGDVDLPAGQFAAVHASLLVSFLGGQGATVQTGPCLPPLAPALEARFAALEGALAAETRERKAAEATAAARADNASGGMIAGFVLLGLLSLAGLVLPMLRRPRPAAPVNDQTLH